MDLAPSVVRKIILEEHSQLRTKLDEIAKLIENQDFGALQNALREFSHFFLNHVAQEEKILRPVLKDIDSWGNVRVDRMNQEHAVQRKEIRQLDELISTGKPELYLRRTQVFLTELRKDMESEEKDCLSPTLLKDDPINVDYGSS